MKLMTAIVATLVTIAGLLIVAAPAMAHPCLGPVHHLGCHHAGFDPYDHYGRHRLHWHDAPVIVALPPPQPEPSLPYQDFYPPMPASLFDLPPDHDFLNHLR
ncbi:MAG: hypothetical protein ABSC72_05880 [Methylovirgula sp.]|jgi:hypothetical protein